jgi:hypothetical protein
MPKDHRHNIPANVPAQLALLRWTVRRGAITAEALAIQAGFTLASARARLHAAERAGLLARRSLLAGRPTLYVATRAGTRASELRGFEPCRITVANASHTIACACAAASLERAYPDHRVSGERELRMQEHECGEALASACLGYDADGRRLLHRPDLVLWPDDTGQPPIAVEVELTVKGSRRLLEICRAWARCRCVAGTLYLADDDVKRPLARAIAQAHAQDRIVLVGLGALAPEHDHSCSSREPAAAN